MLWVSTGQSFPSRVIVIVLCVYLVVIAERSIIVNSTVYRIGFKFLSFYDERFLYILWNGRWLGYQMIKCLYVRVFRFSVEGLFLCNSSRLGNSIRALAYHNVWSPAKRLLTSKISLCDTAKSKLKSENKNSIIMIVKENVFAKKCKI